jgi:peptide/nickel transport system permease protein
MWIYIVRRILLTIPTVLGIVLLTFLLFSLVSKDPARAYAGKQASPQTLEAIRAKMGLNKPKFFNIAAVRQRGASAFFDSQFFDLLFFRFPQSMRYEDSVWHLLKTKGPVSLAIQIPAFLVLLGLELVIALYVANRRGQFADVLVTTISTLGMSIPALSIYLAAQWFFAAQLRIFPVAGWESGFYAIHFAALPILCVIFSQLGWGARFYRTVVLDELNLDYVRTARAKGLPQREVLLTHVLRNVMIPMVTNTIAALPFLLLGALVLEHLFQIPGMGELIYQAIFNQDRSVVMGIVYLTSIAYCLALLVSDILYAVVDPRISLK